jgi:hypothetical protein
LSPLSLAAPRLGMIMAAERDHTQAEWLSRRERGGSENEEAPLSEGTVC